MCKAFIWSEQHSSVSSAAFEIHSFKMWAKKPPKIFSLKPFNWIKQGHLPQKTEKNCLLNKIFCCTTKNVFLLVFIFLVISGCSPVPVGKKRKDYHNSRLQTEKFYTSLNICKATASFLLHFSALLAAFGLMSFLSWLLSPSTRAEA